MTATAPEPGVYADLQELVRLEFRARGYSLLPRQPVHSVLSGRRASRLRGRGLNFEEIRRYQPGDDIRTIDWKVTARTRRPQVRVYTEERDRPVLLVVDQRQAMFFGSRRAMKSVVAAEAAALAAWRVLAVGDRVGALVFDDRDIVDLAPVRSRVQVLRILEAIVQKNRALCVGPGRPSDPGMLNTALARAARRATHDTLICVVTDGSGSDAETTRLVTQLSAHNDVLIVLVRDPLEAELPDAGRLIMAEADRQLEVDTSESDLRRRYAEDSRRRLAEAYRLSRRRQIPVLPLDTVEDVAVQLRTLLGKRRPRTA